MQAGELWVMGYRRLENGDVEDRDDERAGG